MLVGEEHQPDGNEIKPSVDVAAKIAAALEVTLDYLVTCTEQVLDKNDLQRLQDIQALDSEAIF